METLSPAAIAALMPLLEREAPRYTSYPSAHHFRELGPETQAAWLSRLPAGERVGLYLHVPFCEEMCWFCGCNTKATHRHGPVEAYVDALVAEIALAAARLPARQRLHSIHFGGGSPTILSCDEMRRVFEAIDAAFQRDRATEIAIEIDPRRLTVEKVWTYAALGFNRASLGVQDTDPRVMAAINRLQPVETVRAAADLLRGEGISGLSIDIMYGLPMQTPQTIDRTLRDVAEIGPDRIACFSYAHIPWVKKHQTLIDGAALPDGAAKAAAFLQIASGLAALGYGAVGMDHFARPRDDMARSLATRTLRRNFQGYTTLPNDLLIGVGASAISEMPGGIAQNFTPNRQHRQAIMAGRLATARGWIYTPEDRMRRAVIGDLMCFFEADVEAILRRFGYDPGHLDSEIESLAPYVAAGIASVEGRTVRFHSPLRMLVRPVAAAFDAYAGAASAEKRFSKVA